jgi:hypothetical protein
MGKIANKFTKEEIEIMFFLLRDYLLEHEVIYPNDVPKNYYKLFNRLTEMREIIK